MGSKYPVLKSSEVIKHLRSLDLFLNLKRAVMQNMLK